VFPDATFVVTHRDPVSVTASLATMVAYGMRLGTASPRPAADRRVLVGPHRGDAARVRARPRRAARPTARSTCGSTSSWPTTWAPSNGSTSSRASR
jgi:hypothetical protein